MLSVRAAGPTIHHEALDWATRASANGGVISTATIRAVSEFCRAVDLAGVRSKIYRFNPFAGGNLSGALVPLYRGPAYGGTTYGNTTDTNVNFVSGDYVDTGATAGIKGNGSTKYLDTGVLANTFTASNSHLGVGVRSDDTKTGSTRTAIGAYNNGSNSWEIGLRNATTPSVFFTRPGTSTDRMGDNSGLYALLAQGDLVAAWPQLYRNGIAAGSAATTSQNYPSAHRLYVFANNNSNASVISHTDARFGWYSIGATMTASQVAAYSTALANLRTALGR